MQRTIWNGSVLTGCGTRQRCRCSPFAAALFKSAVLPVPLKRNCRIIITPRENAGFAERPHRDHNTSRA